MGLVKDAFGDAVLTFLWVFNLPVVGILTKLTTAYLGVQAMSMAGFLVTTLLITTNVFIFGVIGNLLGGASFNPNASVSFYAAGLKPGSSVTSMAVRFPLQAAAGVVGAMAILQVVPQPYKNSLKGPSLKVDLHTGAVAEGIVTFLHNLAILVISLRGPRSLLVKLWLLSVTTVTLVMVGSAYTGPSLNPANAFGWAYVNNWHNTWEHFYVYWISPLVGAVMAAWVFQVIFPPPAKKPKKA